MVKGFWLIILASLVPQLAEAKIVFLDLNFSEEEVAVVRSEAKRRGEELVVIPDYSRLPAEELENLRKNKKEYYALKRRHGNRVSTIERFDELDRYFEKYRVKAAQIESALKENGAGAETLIISGHSEGFTFAGVTGSISRYETADLVKSAGVDRTLKSLYLWGCYSATGGTVESWDRVLPEADFLIGYRTKGNEATDPHGPKKLASALEDEARVRAKQSNDQLLAVIKKINGPDVRHSLAARVGDRFVCSYKNQVLRLDQLKATCPEQLEALVSELVNSFVPYHSGSAVVPEDTNETKLRRFYSELQGSSACLAHCMAHEEGIRTLGKMDIDQIDYQPYTLIPCPGTMLALIKYPAIVENYRRLYRDEFEFLKPLVSGEKRLSETCRNLLTGKFTANDRAFFDEVLNTKCGDSVRGTTLFPIVERIQRRWNALLYDLEAAPFSWIDVQASPDRPVILPDSDTVARPTDLNPITSF